MNAIVLPHWMVSAVCVCPGGAYPSYAHGCYERDNRFYQRWDDIARERERFEAWMQEHVLGSARPCAVRSQRLQVRPHEHAPTAPMR